MTGTEGTGTGTPVVGTSGTEGTEGEPAGAVPTGYVVPGVTVSTEGTDSTGVV